MSEEHFTLMDGRLHVYRRENSRFWQCSTFLGGRNHRATTKEENSALAKEFATDWYAERCVEDKRRRRGEALGIEDAATTFSLDRRRRPKVTGPTFRQATDQFVREYAVITDGQRSPLYIRGMEEKLRVHLLPFFGDRALAEITPGLVQEYRIHRIEGHREKQQRMIAARLERAAAEQERETKRRRRKATPRAPAAAPIEQSPRPLARTTLHHEIITLRHVLKTANRHGWLEIIPDLSTPYRSSGKVSHRAWFSPEEYKRLYEATGKRAATPKNPRWRKECEQLHDYVLFMANTGLRPDEAARLEYRDVAIVEDDDTGDTILEIEVRGKRGVGYCKSMPGAVHPFERLIARNNPAPSALVFGKTQRELFNAVLGELKLKFDRDGNRRTAYSLRHTYICMRLMEGADIYQVAKNCRTSVEMIEKYYASHIKNTLNAAAINTRKPKRKARAKAKPRRVGDA
jgi:integrase